MAIGNCFQSLICVYGLHEDCTNLSCDCRCHGV